MSKINTGYSLNECPPMKETIIYSIQQIIVAVFNVIPVPLLIGAGIGLRWWMKQRNEIIQTKSEKNFWQKRHQEFMD